MFEIRDLREDERIPTPVMVEDRELRHDAGVPITLDDIPVGTLCVLSEDPGQLTDKQSDQFLILAELANRQIQLQQTKRRSEFLASHDPVTELPNRRSLLKALETSLQDPNVEQITAGICRLYEFARVEETLGEGPDQLEEVDMLRNNGCDYAQGYYYSKPVPPEQYRSFVREFE